MRALQILGALALGFGLGWLAQQRRQEQQFKQGALALKKALEQLPKDGAFKNARAVNTQQFHHVLREFEHPPEPPLRLDPFKWAGMPVQVTLADGTTHAGRITNVWSSQMRVDVRLDLGRSLLGVAHEAETGRPHWQPVGWEAVNHHDRTP